MLKANFLSMAIFIFAERSTSTQHCIDFSKELERSLGLFNAGFLASYFPQIVAVTSALILYVFFTKAFSKPKRFLALISLPITYLTTLVLTNFLITDILSYCF